MPPFTEAEARALLERVLARSSAEGCEASLSSGRFGSLRFARNTVTTSVVREDATLTVHAYYGRRSASASVNELDAATLARAVRQAEERARLAPENPELEPLLGPQVYTPVPSTFDPAIAALPATRRVDAAARAITEAERHGCVAAGSFADAASCTAALNSRGAFRYFTSTGAHCGITLRTATGLGSGWSGRDVHRIADLDVERLATVARAKAVASRTVRTLEPGKYTVVLEPAAAAELLGPWLVPDARGVAEGRTFLNGPGGRSRVGEKVFDERVTIYSDPTTPDLPCQPWDGEGLPRHRTVWIDRGVVRRLPCSRYWARREGREPVASPGNWIMGGSEASLEELVRGTEQGILVTRLWYVGLVDRRTLLCTGVTRDGTFYIERGRVAYAVKNFRFNESPLTMLNNLEALGRPERVGDRMAPPVRVRSFTFSSLSNAV